MYVCIKKVLYFLKKTYENSYSLTTRYTISFHLPHTKTKKNERNEKCKKFSNETKDDKRNEKFK